MAFQLQCVTALADGRKWRDLPRAFVVVFCATVMREMGVAISSQAKEFYLVIPSTLGLREIAPATGIYPSQLRVLCEKRLFSIKAGPPQPHSSAFL